MKSIFLKTAFTFLVCIALSQTSSARGWHHGYRCHRHVERPRAYVYVAPQPFVQPYYNAPQPYYPPMVYGHPHFHGGYGWRGGYRR